MAEKTRDFARADAERHRLAAARGSGVPWRKWGPYLSERQWGTVREDYSVDGDPWASFTHDQARSRAYHWGEDGLAGFSDDHQRLCFAIALWNGRDPILKERLFGLTNAEGNHGEDVKEYYFYLDATPTHSYMKWLYKYPQRAYPYDELVAVNARRSHHDFEYELLDTGVFAGDRYFDVQVEYAKADVEDVLIRITAFNRGPDAAVLHVLPTLWFRNTWRTAPDGSKPSLGAANAGAGVRIITAQHADLGRRWLYTSGDGPLLFTDNETNRERLFGQPNTSRFVKDGINDFVVSGRGDAVNLERVGTKAAAHCIATVDAGGAAVWNVRLTNRAPEVLPDPFAQFHETFDTRQHEADEFYASIAPHGTKAESAGVMRQALAGMLWNKQYYYLDAARWLGEHGIRPFATSPSKTRNDEWGHLLNADVISMPDKWEYPWYSAWDLALHAIALSTVDLDFAKDQLEMMLREMYLHPSGQMPASEWNFSGVHPPVHAWAMVFLHHTERTLHGRGDIDFLKRSFGKLLANFTWWMNRRDRFGKNVLEGGFLGLDTAGVLDRAQSLPTGGHVEQADASAWMALFCQNMLEIAVEIASEDPTFESMAVGLVDHFLAIGHALNNIGESGMWDDADGFYYGVLRLPDGHTTRLELRSFVGLLPLCATTVFEPSQRRRVPKVMEHLRERARRSPALFRSIHASGEGHFGHGGRGIMAVVDEPRLRRILEKMLDEREFLSPYGIRSLSKFHEEHPYVVQAGGFDHRVTYAPAESPTRAFGGNSNWRGPVWMPVNVLLIRALLQFYLFHGDSFTVECPTGSGRRMHLFDVAKEIVARLTRIFLQDAEGRRPVFGGADIFQTDPHWREHLLFYEYFHGDNGAGLGASHQTGWTGLIAPLVALFGTIGAREYLELGRGAMEQRLTPVGVGSHYENVMTPDPNPTGGR